MAMHHPLMKDLCVIKHCQGNTFRATMNNKLWGCADFVIVAHVIITQLHLQ